MGYVVMVDDNFHFMDKGSRYRLGDFQDADTAVDHCRRIVDEYLASALEPGMTPGALYKSYAMFGEDPYICCGDVLLMSCSVCDYAREQISLMCAADQLCQNLFATFGCSSKEKHVQKPL